MQVYKGIQRVLEDTVITRNFTLFSEIDQKGSTFVYHSGVFELIFPERVQAKMGDTIVVTAKISRKPKRLTDFFSMRIRLVIQSYLIIKRREDSGNVFVGVFLEKVANIRRNFLEFFGSTLPPDSAALASGVLIGSQLPMTPQFTQIFRRTGTMHIIAASGYNVSIVLSFIIGKTLIKGSKVKTLIALFFLLLYTAISGFSVSVLRAAVMAILALYAVSRGRQYSAGWALVLISAGFLLVNPFLVFSLSFLLSFCSTAGIILIYPYFQEVFIKRFRAKILRNIGETVGLTLAASLGTFPIQVIFFDSISLVSPLANPAVLWMIPYMMFFAASAPITKLVSPYLLDVSLEMLTLTIALFSSILRFFASFPLANVSFRGQKLWIIGLWCAGICGLLVAKQRFSVKKYRNERNILS